MDETDQDMIARIDRHLAPMIKRHILRINYFLRSLVARINRSGLNSSREQARSSAESDLLRYEALFDIINDKITANELAITTLAQELRRLDADIVDLERAERDATGYRRRRIESLRWKMTEKRHELEDKLWKAFDGGSDLAAESRDAFTEILKTERTVAEFEMRDEKQQREVTRVKNVPVIGKPKRGEHLGIRDFLSMSLRMFRVKPVMTVLTILGIGVSFGTIFLFVSFGYGLEQILLAKISSETSLRTVEVTSPNDEIIPMKREFVNSLTGNPSVEKIIPISILPGHLESDGVVAETKLFVVEKNYLSDSAAQFIEGIAPSNAGEAAISLSLLNLVGKRSLSELKGKTVDLTPFRDSAGALPVATTSFVISGIVDNNESIAYLLIDALNEPPQTYQHISVVAREIDNLAPLREFIAGEGFLTSSVGDTVEQATQVFHVFEIVLALFGASALIVATIGMFNTMTVSLLERTQEIGIMKILGVSDPDVRSLFLAESAIIGFLGGVSGLALGYAVARMVNFFVNLLATNLGGVAVDLFYFPDWFVAAILFSAFGIGVLTGVVPARHAAHMDPIEAIKYK